VPDSATGLSSAAQLPTYPPTQLTRHEEGSSKPSNPERPPPGYATNEQHQAQLSSCSSSNGFPSSSRAFFRLKQGTIVRPARHPHQQLTRVSTETRELPTRASSIDFRISRAGGGATTRRSTSPPAASRLTPTTTRTARAGAPCCSGGLPPSATPSPPPSSRMPLHSINSSLISRLVPRAPRMSACTPPPPIMHVQLCVSSLCGMDYDFLLKLLAQNSKGSN
jgi:hypothetical protein